MNRMVHKPNRIEPIRHEYNQIASEYDSRWYSYIKATLNATLKRLDIIASDRLLDVGCGTASLFQTMFMKHTSIEMLGVDLSTEMLKIAHNKLGDKATFLAAEAQSLPFGSGSFDIVISCNSFHYWRRPEQCLSEIGRVLKPGGRIVITDWCDDFVTCQFGDFFLRTFNRAHFKTYRAREFDRLLRVAGFGNISIERYKINWYWGLMTVKAQINAVEQ